MAQSRRCAWICALALTGCLVSCSAGAPDDTVRFWSFTGIQQARQVEEYLTEFPAASIELSEVGTSVETADALVAALAAGDPPDLVLIQGDDLPRFVAAGHLFRDLGDFAAYNEVYASYFTAPYPVRTTVQAGLAAGLKVEIDVVARRG